MIQIPTAQPRLANARDLGDVAPGIRKGVAFRSDAPLAGDVPPDSLGSWPPATVVDLRGAQEKGQPHALREVSRVVELDILDDANLTGEAAQQVLTSLAALYQTMLDGEPARGLTQMVAEVARDDTPVLFHCSAGKDRAGVSAALILRLLGVDRATVIADYAATGANMPGVIARMLQGLPEGISESALAAVPSEIFEAPALAIESVLNAWDGHDDGTEGWYLANGGDPETLAVLRARLLASPHS